MQQRYNSGGGGGRGPGGNPPRRSDLDRGRGGDRTEPRNAQVLQDGTSAKRSPLIPSETLPRYFGDGSKAARRELLTEEAQRLGKALVEAKLKSTQLRRFYGPVLALKRHLEMNDGVTDEEVAAQLALIKARVAYGYARGVCPRDLVQFFTDHAAAIKSRDDFIHGFVPHFEAVVAYHRFTEMEQEQRKGVHE